jgi:hypothetical protein
MTIFVFRLQHGNLLAVNHLLCAHHCGPSSTFFEHCLMCVDTVGDFYFFVARVFCMLTWQHQHAPMKFFVTAEGCVSNTTACSQCAAINRRLQECTLLELHAVIIARKSDCFLYSHLNHHKSASRLSITTISTLVLAKVFG